MNRLSSSLLSLVALASIALAQTAPNGVEPGPSASSRMPIPHPTTWYVDVNATPPGNGRQPTPYASIQYAIAQPTTLDRDTIVVLPGTYLEHLDFAGKNLRVVSTDGPDVTLVDGAGSGSVVTFHSGEGREAVLEGFTLRGGTGSGVSPEIRGGGVLCVDAFPTLRNLVVRENKAKRGAGMYFANSSARVEACVIEDNAPPPPYASANYGGGVYVACGSAVVFDHCTMRRNRPTPNVTNLRQGGGVYGGGTYLGCTIEDNSAFRGSGVDGGGCNPQLFDCLIRANVNIDGATDNITSVGGGVAGQAVLTRCTIESNSAWFSGGGVYLATLHSCTVAENTVQRQTVFGITRSEGGGASNCVLDDCDVFGNVATPAFDSSGGGLASSVATRCRIYGNQARSGGGAANTSLEQCSVYGNQAGTNGGGALVVQSGIAYGVHNSILYGNSPNQITVSSGSANASYSDVQGGYAGTGNINADPMFASASGGDFHLLAGSPCIDAGDPTTFDPDGSRADMGALPYAPGLLAAMDSERGWRPTLVASSTGSLALDGVEDFYVTCTVAPEHAGAVLLWTLERAAPIASDGSHAPASGWTRAVDSESVTRSTLSSGAARYEYHLSRAGMRTHGLRPFDRLRFQWWTHDGAVIESSQPLRFDVLP